MAEPTLIRIKRRRPGLIARFWWIVPVAALAWWGGSWMMRPRASGPSLPGYISGSSNLSQEYARYYRKRLTNQEWISLFDDADKRCAAGDYRGAVALLVTIADEARLPMIYNDLGILYAALSDHSRAINAFRDALARDLTYQPVRYNLEQLKSLNKALAEPVSREVEPNETVLLANVIALSQPVEGEIAAGADSDFFEFTAPPAPRDILAVDVLNKSKSLIPMLNFYDSDKRLLDWRPTAAEEGAALHFQFSPEPNAAISLRIRGYGDSAGGYILAVAALRRFDAFEANDDIMNPTRVRIGETVKANIMDARDTDYYSFAAPRTGKVTVEIVNRSAILVPQLSTFTSDMRTSGFGPDVKKPGADLTHQIDVSAGQIYSIQVWPAMDSSGDYELTVR